MAPDRSSPASSDDTPTAVSDEQPSPPSSPSVSSDSAPEPDASVSSSSLLVSSGSGSGSGSDSEPVVPKKPRPPLRSWPASDEIELLEAVLSHRQKHGRLPPPDDLAAALRGRIPGGRAEDRLGAEQVTRRLNTLRTRYGTAVARLARGVIPEKEDDVTIYRLSKLIWADTRTGKRQRKSRAADAREEPRGFAELAELYPCLAAEVEAIDAACGGAALRAFGRIGDDTAARLEAKVKKQRVAEVKASAELERLRRNVASMLMGVIE